MGSPSATALVVYGVPKEKLWTENKEERTKTKYDPDTGIPYQDYYYVDYYESFGKRYDDIEDFFTDNFGEEYLDGYKVGEFTYEQEIVGIIVARAKHGYYNDERVMKIPEDKVQEKKLDVILDKIGYNGDKQYYLISNCNY